MSTQTTKPENFDKALTSFIAGCQQLIDKEHADNNHSDLLKRTLEAQIGGRRYVRIVNVERGAVSSVYAFVDQNGDVLKPASFKTPAAHPRGNHTAKWQDGTVPSDASNPTPYGFLVYAKPRYKVTYSYPEGDRTTVEYEHVPEREDDEEKRPNLFFLNETCSMRAPGTGFGERSVELSEVTYTEALALFFVNSIKAVWNINERVKALNDPKVLLELVAKGQKMLG